MSDPHTAVDVLAAHRRPPMSGQSTPTDRLIDTVATIVAAQRGPCADYLCESKRTGNGADCALTRGTVADVLAALGDSRYGMLIDIATEMDHQDRQWGQQDHPDGTGPDGELFGVTFTELRDMIRNACQRAAADGTVTWAHIAGEEATEALAESDPDRLRTEVIQATAVGAQWVGSIDRRQARERCKTATPARVPYAELTTEPDGTLTADSTITVRSAAGLIIAHVNVPERHSGGGILAPRRIGEALASAGYRQADDWGPVVNGHRRANLEQIETDTPA
jgi:hypothetical protein